MDLSLSYDKGYTRTDDSSLFSLLESGLHCAQKRHYVEGVIFFKLAHERLLPDQVQLSDVLDALIQSYTRYSHAQNELIQASRRVAKEDIEQQTLLSALADLLLTLAGETKEPPRNTVQASTLKSVSDNHLLSLLRSLPEKLDCGQLQVQSPQLPHGDTRDNQSVPLSQSLNEVSPTLPALFITCFGHFEVRQMAKPVILCSSRNGQTILRYLIAQPGYCVSIDKLMAVFWPEDEPEVAQNKLYIAISALRRSLNDGSKYKSGCGYITCKNRNYYLGPKSTIHTDVDEFLQFYQLGQQRSEEREAFYEKACSLYTGPFLVED